MPTTTWQATIREISRALGYVEFATTTNITTNTSIVSTQLADDYPNNSFFSSPGWFVIIRGANNDEVVRRVTAYTASSGTLTVAGAALSAESGSMTCELHRFNPTHIRDHFNRARQEVFPQVAIVRNHETIVTGQQQHRYRLPSTLRGKPVRVMLGKRTPAENVVQNEITDPSFENWSSGTALASWSVTGSGSTVNQEKQTTSPRNYAVLEGDNSARVQTATSVVTTLLQTVTPSVASESMEYNFSVWVYATTAALISVSVGGTLGGKHGGTGWELLTSTLTTPVLSSANATTMAVGVSSASDGTAISFYVDEAVLIVGQEEPVGYDWETITNWRWVPPVAGEANNGLLEFPMLLPEQHRLRVVGRDLISSVSADSDTIEVDGELLTPLLEYTRFLLARDAANTALSGANNYWREREREFFSAYQNELNNGRVVSLPIPKLLVPNG